MSMGVVIAGKLPDLYVVYLRSHVPPCPLDSCCYHHLPNLLNLHVHPFHYHISAPLSTCRLPPPGIIKLSSSLVTTLYTFHTAFCTRPQLVVWSCSFIKDLPLEKDGHDFCGMYIQLSCIIVNVLFLLTQWVDLDCVGIEYSLWQTCSS